jgi:hypothetical protein
MLLNTLSQKNKTGGKGKEKGKRMKGIGKEVRGVGVVRR